MTGEQLLHEPRARAAIAVVAAVVVALVAAAAVLVGWMSPPAASASAIRMDAGALAPVVAPDGSTYAASSGFAGGRAGTVPTKPMTGRLGDTILRTTWVGMTAWSTAVPNGTYRVTLAMAETYWTTKGQRVFSARAEGVAMFTNLDLVAVAGTRTEVDRSLQVTVADGRIDVAFTATKDRATVAAIVVEPVVTSSSPATTSATTSSSSTPTDAVLVAVGDIACATTDAGYAGGAGTATTCRQKAVSDVVVADTGMTAFAALGDNQYQNGELAQYQAVYAPTFGRVLDRTIPVAGNHEYQTSGAAGYYNYFGARAGDRTKGYYSTTVGAWHVVVLNTNCAAVGGCQAGSPQEQWLRADLAAHPARCTVALTHHPRWSSGEHGSTAAVADLWKALHAGGADLVLSGHDHDYERLAPMDAAGSPEAAGMRQFVVGTGGKSLRPFGAVLGTSQVRNASTYGVLRLTLQATGYSWRFVPVSGATWTDTGTATCR